MKKGYIEQSKRKTILFLSDDCRLPSGIGTMTRELIVGNAHRFNFVQLGGAVKHPEAGKIFDLKDDINKQTGLTDSSVLIYPFDGYGNPEVVRGLIEKHNADLVIHFTDPRYWTWLYRMSSELRQKLPIAYYHIWDDLPAPHYNKPFYESCDLLMGISKQSDNIARIVLGKDNYIDLDAQPDADISKAVPKTCFVPHGINTELFYPISQSDDRVVKMRKEMFKDNDPEFVMLHNNRNIRRKMTSDVIFSFKLAYDEVLISKGKDVADKMRLILHTQPIDENGTHIPNVIKNVFPEVEHLITITNSKLTSQDLNLLYNCCDVVINIASNEGWGLSSTEAMVTETPIINNVTGGLQDQCRFEDESGEWIKFTEDFGSNHAGKYKKHGIWVNPVFPSTISIQGSVPTPYIFDDRCDVRDVKDAILYWYNMPRNMRQECGKAGRIWAVSKEANFTSEAMCEKAGDMMQKLLDEWKPIPRFNMYNVQEELAKTKNKKTGISL